MLEKWCIRLAGLLDEEPLSFTPLDCFDKAKGYELKAEVSEKHANDKFGLTVGTHLGKPLPPICHIKSGV